MHRQKIDEIIENAFEEKWTKLNLSEKEISEFPLRILQLTNLTELDLRGNQLSTLPAEIAQLTNLTSLDLSVNELSTLPPEIGKLTNLTELNLRGNQLSTLPPEIAQLTSLTKLYLNRNQLSTLPLEIAQLTNLTELDLNRNQLSTLPPEIAQLTSLTKLDLNRNQLSTLPPEIAQLTNLTELDLSINELSTLPAEIAQLTNLTELDLSTNELSTLPAEIAQLTNLTKLDLINNQLNTLPPEIAQLTNLTKLYLGNNQLSTLPQEFTQLTNLTLLYLSSNQLSTLPQEFTQLTNLTTLYLSGNQLSTLPPEIAQLTNLTLLYLGNNQLSTLPPEIAQLTNLASLHLSGNQLSTLPPEITELTNLTELDLSVNELSTLPPEIGKLSNLTKIDLRSNQLSTLPPEITQLTNLTELDLSVNQFRTLPPEITQLTNLTELDLSDNQFRTLPPEIGKLSNLTKIDLRSNQLSTLPPEITQLTNLTELDLSVNQFRTLPPEIAQLTNLTLLFLGGNQLSTLPPEIAQLTNLTELDLSDNQFRTLPPEIGKLTTLRMFDLSLNQLSSLPTEFSQLHNLFVLNMSQNRLTKFSSELLAIPKLRLLDLSENQLNSVPPEIANIRIISGGELYFSFRPTITIMKVLSKINENINLDKNPLSIYPSEIVEQGTPALLEYFRELLRGCRQQWVSKLILVGEGGVGKTCLLSALRGEEFAESSTTRGIEIRPLILQHPTQPDTTLTLNAWDFGGQEIYHATHQFFLTNRSLFLLIWNARHGYEQGKLYYWLDAIQARAPESPVLIVATWLDERDADLPLEDLRRKYPQIKGFFKVSNKNGDGIQAVKQEIAKISATDLPLMGEKWPTTWLEAANTIRGDPRKYMQPAEFWRIFSDKGVSKAGARVLARWMHELGDILYFRDDDDLNDLIILKPQWVSQYIGKVLESDDVIAQDGIFSDGHMASLWGDLDPAMRQHFLRLMEKFDLSYRTMDKEEVSLVVERLPLDPPDYQTIWNQNTGGVRHEIAMKFKLNTILPGIPTWFIARSHRFTTHTHWRLGAVFSDPEKRHLALVQTFQHDRYVQLTVKGPSPYNFFALLKDGLEETFKRYPGLKIERTIPCPEQDGYEFNFENLQKAIEREKPVESVQCQSSFEQIPVSTLLFGLHWRTQDKVIAEIEELKIMMNQHDKDSRERHDELLTLLQREFLKSYRREQSQLETYCPNIFVLRPYASKAWKRTLIGEKLELQLYCQSPGCWHLTGDNGRYLFDYPPRWLRTMGPYLGDMIKVLKFVTPLVGPWIGIHAAGYAELIKHDIQLMEELVKIIPDLVEPDEISQTEKLQIDILASSPLAIEGAPLRSIRLLLEKLDEQQVWGGLQRIATPEGPYLWLCEHHAKEYKSSDRIV